MVNKATIYEDYAVLDAQIRVLIEQKNKVKEDILEELAEGGETTVETAVGKFTVSNIKTWKYTDKVYELEEKFKAQKATEQSTGDATFEEKPSLRFTGIKF